MFFNILLDFIDVKGWKANGNKLGGYSRMSGFKIIEVSNEIELSDNVQKDEQKLLPQAPKSYQIVF